jgi:urease accessory protein
MTPVMAELLLADGRFPAGGHAHSGGVEAAVAAGRVVDEATLEDFVVGRLATTGLTEAALAAATVHRVSETGPADRPGAPVPPGPPATPIDRSQVAAVLASLDAEAEARITSPPLRAASRKLGRQLVRVAGRCWPDPVLVEAASRRRGLHQAVALGAVGVAAGLDGAAVARLSVHHAVTTPAQAAVRLLGLDPFGVAALVARVAAGPVAAAVIAEAMAAAAGPPADLPARSAPTLDLDAADHRAWDVRLFAT